MRHPSERGELSASAERAGMTSTQPAEARLESGEPASPGCEDVVEDAAAQA